MYTIKEQVPAEVGIDSLSPLNILSSPPAKRVRSKGRAASLPNFSSVANQLAAFGALQEAHTRRSSGTLASNSDSEDLRGSVYPTFEVLHPLGHPLASMTGHSASTTVGSSFSSSSYHAPPIESSTSDLGFGPDGVFTDSVFMDGLFESCDYNLLPGLELLDGLDASLPNSARGVGGISSTSHSHAYTTSEEVQESSFRSNCRSESVDSTADVQHHMPMPAHASFGSYGSYVREDYNVRTTRSNSCPHHYIPPASNMSNDGVMYNSCHSMGSVDYTSGSTEYILSQNHHLNALMQALPPPPVQFVPFNPAPPVYSSPNQHGSVKSEGSNDL